jgi:hypothetical protein
LEFIEVDDSLGFTTFIFEANGCFVGVVHCCWLASDPVNVDLFNLYVLLLAVGETESNPTKFILIF